MSDNNATNENANDKNKNNNDNKDDSHSAEAMMTPVLPPLDFKSNKHNANRVEISENTSMKPAVAGKALISTDSVMVSVTPLGDVTNK